MDRVDGYYHTQVTVAAGPSLAARMGVRKRSVARPRIRKLAAGDPRVVLAGAGQARREEAGTEGPRRIRRATPRRRVRRSSGWWMRPARRSKADVDVKVALAEAAGRLDARGVAPVLEAQLKSDPSVLVRTAVVARAAGNEGRRHERADGDRAGRQGSGGAARGPRPAARAADHAGRQGGAPRRRS